jgi:hypothetical protein
MQAVLTPRTKFLPSWGAKLAYDTDILDLDSKTRNAYRRNRMYPFTYTQTVTNIFEIEFRGHISDKLLAKLQHSDVIDFSDNLLRELNIAQSMRVTTLQLHNNLFTKFPNLQGTAALVCWDGLW